MTDDGPVLRVLFGPVTLIGTVAAGRAELAFTVHPHAPVRGDRCAAVLGVPAGAEVEQLEPASIDGRTSRYAVEVEHLGALAARVPLRMSLCGVDLRFDARALRALRHFVALARQPD